jgi:hypothetical protein
MSKNNATTWFQHPAYTDAEFATRNPYLFVGEAVFIRDSLTARVTQFKVGPGLYNDLPFINDIYPYADVPINPIGDAKINMQGLTPAEILFKMLNPYQGSEITNAQNNATGSAANVSLLEIGQSLTGPILVQFAVSHIDKLFGASPIIIEAAGAFINEGNFPLGVASLNFAAPYNPTLASKIEIKVKATHMQGVSDPFTTTILHHPKIIWGISPNATLSPGDWNALTLRKTVITDNFERDYDFGTVGYVHLAIPTMLAPANLKFSDVTNPEAPFGFSIIDDGTQSINNGVSTYTYQHYRSEFYLSESSILRVRK